ncbi:hypothetical protein Deipr_0264 [Deinococcus proteolyticus MRP]|uniref:Uncharacterized protein n=1 Tax=Deinococcus proteolyticus (strain ATCC 35074 / DSM 20540 / JCM 6276 / NBRC 101906 / NCIMB 13154 / VKM Ac-1939 / CCM 2703 / MRP) TaxID=693977 RepID=F0RJ29_DEIPM|nr:MULTISPECIES: hypothetical protein [Deinococcus]ADY25437.1 hypothetical protein Deipr_0264 [Deinococcus proteolyticus MRP]MCY1701560.1 hypothetical protein [Deinococcus sp. SL84]
MNAPGRLLLALLCLAAALPGSWAGAQSAPGAAAAAAPFAPEGPKTPEAPVEAPGSPAFTSTGATRWNASALPAGDPAFELKAPAGTGVTLLQVGSTAFELSKLEVSGLGNAGNAALEQELRAGFRALDTLGQSQGRTVNLQVLSRTPAGTELTTRWTETPEVTAPAPASGTPDLQLRQLLLPGGVRGPVEVSSPDPVLAARYRLLGSAELESLSPAAGAPYGAALSAGERVSGLGQQPVLPLFQAALGAAPALRDWALPDLSRAELPPLDVRRERVYQGQNSRGDFLFQTQSRAQPWRQVLEGPQSVQEPGTGRSTLTLEVLDMAQMSQAVYRADGLPHSAFEFSTLQLQVTARSGAAEVRFTVQVRSTSALRPVGS